jgi:hypothetical protein
VVVDGGDDANRILAQRILIGSAAALGALCFILGTPDDPPAYALASNLILRIERAALPIAEDATKPTATLKEGVDKDVRALSERLLRLEKIIERRGASDDRQE